MAIINGTPNNDLLQGDRENDIISGFNGNDTLIGNGGNDILSGGDRNDSLDGGNDSDLLRGENGSDTLSGGNGSDLLSGGDGNDLLNGGNDSDFLTGENGTDTLNGGNGSDFLNGGDGSDLLNGGNDGDFLTGENGSDTLNGGDGNDNLNGGDGNDIVSGGSGDDIVVGENGTDILLGGSGMDTISGGDGNDLVLGGRGNDSIDAGNGNDLIDGGDGNDMIAAQDGDDGVIGGAGNDTLNGGNGNDVLVGGGGSRLLGLTDNNTLVAFDAASPDQASTIRVNGVDGKLIGIDVRPANGLLYGVTDTNKIYIIDPNTGQATSPQNISPVAFNAGQQSGVDFNPIPDLLRLVGSNDQNLRVNVTNGQVADGDPNQAGIQPDANLRYDPGDRNAGRNPNITGAAYTNSFGPSPRPGEQTTLFNIDSDLDVLVTQGSANFPAGGNNAVSPNTGRLFTVGSLGVDFGPKAGFDIVSPANGINIGYAVSGSTLYNINLSTGAATSLGAVGNGSFNFVGLAAVPVPEPSGSGRDVITGGNGSDTLIGGANNDILTGNTGADSYQFANPKEGLDTITDFSVVDDTVVVSAAGFGGGLTRGAVITPDQFTIGAGAVDAFDRFIYNSKTGGLFFDVDGNGAIAQTQIASLSSGLALTNNDILVIA
jgi:Ca2+-binding RTX toxin-like protein